MDSNNRDNKIKSQDPFLVLLQNTDKFELVSTISKFPVPIAILNEDGFFLAVNQCFADIYESDAIFLLGKKLNEFSTVVYSHFIDAVIEFNQNIFLDDIENEFYSKGHFYIVYFRALRDVEKNLNSIIVVGANITKLKRRERVLIQNNKKLHQLLYIDQVTGLKSKMALELFIQEKFVSEKRDQYAFIKIDLEDFKKFNYLHSYSDGDELLRRIGSYFNEEIIQDQAELFRLNSASFVVVVEDTTPWKVLTIAERLRQKIIKSHILFDAENEEFLTVTIGIYHPKIHDQLSESNIMQQLDMAVKQAKTQGQNSIFVLE